MARSINRTPAQAAIARRIAIRRRHQAAGQTLPSFAHKTPSPMLAACVAAAGFAEHAGR